MEHQDEHITCAECGTTFVFTASEADSFASKKLEPPKRCLECRKARRAQRGGGGRPEAGGHRQFGGDVNGYRAPMSDPSASSRGRGESEYRAPGFRDSRPANVGGNHGGPHGGQGEYRAPSFGGQAPAPRRGGDYRGGGEYRAPSFSGQGAPRGGGGGGEYRAPGFGGDRGPRPQGSFRGGQGGGFRGGQGGGQGGGGGFRGGQGGGFRGAPQGGPARDGGGRGGFGGGPRGGQRGDGPPPQRERGPERAEGAERAPRPPRAERPSYPITCAQCNAASEVPFKPQEGREILCRDCYRARKESA